MTKQHNNARAAQILNGLQQFTGDVERWRHSINRRLIYTPGVKFLADRAGAFWLVDAIAIWLASKEFAAAARRDARVGEMHFWRLEVASDRSAVLTAVADSGEAPFIRQTIEFTDFLLPEMSLYCAFDGQHWTLMLLSEY